jgi:glycosyltransferase involved in cell wall biosynthesis
VDSRPLHVAIDGRELVGQPTGVGRYLTAILRAWAAAPGQHRYSVIVPSDPPAAFGDLGPAFECIVESSARPGTLWEQTRLRRAAVRLQPDVFFAPGYTAPLGLACPSVVVVHDVSFFAHPEWFSWREGWRRRWLTRAAAARAAAVITVSQFSAAEITRWMGVPAARIHVARHGPPAVTPPEAVPEREPLILFVGSLFNRRRVPELVEGFAVAAAAHPEARLVLVGSNRTRPALDPIALARDAGVADRVEWHQYVADADLEALYWRARVFAFLSDYEGFAMTPLEALAHGAPPVLLDTPVGREIYGDAARFVRPQAREIGSAMADLLASEPARRQLLEAARPLLDPSAWTRAAGVVRAALEEAAR